MAKENESKALIKTDMLVSIVCSLISVASLLGAWFILPYKVEANDKRMTQNEVANADKFRVLEAKQDADHELAIRIDERLKSIQKALRIPVDP